MYVELQWDVKIIYRIKSSMLSLSKGEGQKFQEKNGTLTVSEFL